MHQCYRDNKEKWQAILTGDEAADNHFLYAVKTTGVYCRPSCRSRDPKRENAEFFLNFQSAEAAGFRPCLRCSPREPSKKVQQQEMAVQACRVLADEIPAPSLKELAARFQLSPHYFQRLFKKHIGLTPKQFSRVCRTRRFRKCLERCGSVTEAIYAAGYSSSSQPYGETEQRFGLSAKTIQRGGKGCTIRFGIAACTLGWVFVGATDRGICLIELGDDPPSLLQQARKRLPLAEFIEAGEVFLSLLDEVVELIDNPANPHTIPLDIQGTVFQERVWAKLLEIPVGVTRSYADIAAELGDRRAARAVAGACAANRLAVAVPCHRVVRGDGGISGYRWGVKRKQALLDRERKVQKKKRSKK